LLPLVITECLMILPATFDWSVAALHSLQQRLHEPARTAWIASEWMIVHLTKAHAAIIVSSIPSHSNRGLALQRCCEAGAKMSCSDGTQ